MATPKKTKKQLTQEIQDLERVLAYAKKELKTIMRLHSRSNLTAQYLEAGFREHMEDTGHDIDRLSRNGYMFRGYTVTGAKILDAQHQTLCELERITKKRVAYLEGQIERRQRMLKK